MWAHMFAKNSSPGKGCAYSGCKAARRLQLPTAFSTSENKPVKADSKKQTSERRCAGIIKRLSLRKVLLSHHRRFSIFQTGPGRRRGRGAKVWQRGGGLRQQAVSGFCYPAKSRACIP